MKNFSCFSNNILWSLHIRSDLAEFNFLSVQTAGTKIKSGHKVDDCNLLVIIIYKCIIFIHLLDVPQVHFGCHSLAINVESKVIRSNGANIRIQTC